MSTLMMEMELDSETRDFIIHLTRLSCREVFIKFCHPENFKDINSADTRHKSHVGRIVASCCVKDVCGIAQLGCDIISCNAFLWFSTSLPLCTCDLFWK